MKRLLMIVIVGAFLSGCGGAEKEKLQSKVDSLQNELQISQQTAQTLQEVGTLMDSIDASRQVLRVNMVEGTTYSAYTSRMKDLNNYVKETQSKIGELEKSLKKSKSNSKAFASTVAKLKSDLEKKNKEIELLQQT